MIRISGIKLPLDYDREDLHKAIAKRLKLAPNRVTEVRLIRRSVDARKKDNIHFVCTAEAKLEISEGLFLKKCKDKGVIKNEESLPEFSQKNNFAHKPVVVGFGPAGMFAGLVLAKRGYEPIIIEQGKKIEHRTKDVQTFFTTAKLNECSNVQFGEGGAGTFSDGKLTTGIRSPFIREILKEFVRCGAPEEILYDAKPHIGTDRLKTVVRGIREKIISLGADIRFNTKLQGLYIEDGAVKGVTVSGAGGTYDISTEHLILAVGHSAVDTFEMLCESGVLMEQKAFSIGVRIEHMQRDVDKAQFGSEYLNKKITPADYKFAVRSNNGRGVYTFCMCPGGVVVPAASQKGCIVTNGMSEYRRDKPNANSALLVSVFPQDFPGKHPLAGFEFKREWERKAFILGGSEYKAPVQLVGDFLNAKKSTAFGSIKPSYSIGTELADLSDCLPRFAVKSLRDGIEKIGVKLKYFTQKDAVLTGVETGSSSPVRIIRDERGTANIKGLYPCGEGAGYAGGIISSACDGFKLGLKL